MIDFKLIGEKIKNIRNEKKITQEELAEMAEISVGYISNIETAKKKVSLTTIIKICKCFVMFGNYHIIKFIFRYRSKY